MVVRGEPCLAKNRQLQMGVNTLLWEVKRIWRNFHMGISVSSITGRQVWLQSDEQGALLQSGKGATFGTGGVGIWIGDDLWVTHHYGLHSRVEVVGWGGLIWIHNGGSGCRNRVLRSSCSTF